MNNEEEPEGHLRQHDAVHGHPAHRAAADYLFPADCVVATDLFVWSMTEFYDIAMPDVSDEFVRCWRSAVKHINTHAQGSLGWLKCWLRPPYLEHFSFRMGNQVFFIRIEDVENRIDLPGTINGLQNIANGWAGVSCLMPMRYTMASWAPANPGWGLIDANTGKAIDPVAKITEEKIEMTDWELHDFAVQVVRDYINSKPGCEVTNSQGNPEVDPAIWFDGPQGLEWVVVRVARIPAEPLLPHNIREISAYCAKQGHPKGHFAPVSVISSEPYYNDSYVPLWRGYGMHVGFRGLVDLPN